jgi:hypothetical protein
VTISINGKPLRFKLRRVTFNEFSAVDVPAHEGALAAIRKSASLIKIDSEPSKETPTMSDLATLTAQLAKAQADLAAVTTERDALNIAAAASATALTKVAALSTAEHAHFVTLGADDRAAFVAKSATDRALAVTAAEAADPVVVEYVDLSGQTFQVRKSANPTTVAMAKQNKLLVEEITKQKAATELVALDKRASAVLGHVKTDQPGRIALVKAVGLLPEAEQAPALAVLKVCDDAFAQLFKRAGSGANPSPESGASPLDRVEVIAKAYAKANKMEYFQAYAVVTDPNHPDCSAEAIEAIENAGNH